MEKPITRCQIENERAERMATLVDGLMAVVRSVVTGEKIRDGVAGFDGSVGVDIPYKPPPTVWLDEFRAACPQSLGLYLATLAFPYDFAYTWSRRLHKKESVYTLVIGPRLKPWYRHIVSFPDTNVMTTDIDVTPKFRHIYGDL